MGGDVEAVTAGQAMHDRVGVQIHHAVVAKSRIRFSGLGIDGIELPVARTEYNLWGSLPIACPVFQAARRRVARTKCERPEFLSRHGIERDHARIRSRQVHDAVLHQRRVSARAEPGAETPTASSGASTAFRTFGRVTNGATGAAPLHGGRAARSACEIGRPHMIGPRNLQPRDIARGQLGQGRETLAAGIVAISGPLLGGGERRAGMEQCVRRHAAVLIRPHDLGRPRFIRRRWSRSRSRYAGICTPREVLRQVVENRGKFGVATLRAEVHHFGKRLLPGCLSLPHRNGLVQRMALAANACGLRLSRAVRKIGCSGKASDAQPSGRKKNSPGKSAGSQAHHALNPHGSLPRMRHLRLGGRRPGGVPFMLLQNSIAADSRHERSNFR